MPFRVVPAGPSAGRFRGPGAGPSVTVERSAQPGEAVIRIARGQMPTGGYGIAVTAVSRQPTTLTVVCRLSDPAPGAMVTMALTFPQVAIAVPADALPPPGGQIVAVTTSGHVLAKCDVN